LLFILSLFSVCKKNYKIFHILLKGSQYERVMIRFLFAYAKVGNVHSLCIAVYMLSVSLCAVVLVTLLGVGKLTINHMINGYNSFN